MKFLWTNEYVLGLALKDYQPSTLRQLGEHIKANQFQKK